MIDIHSHILPEVDDGARSLDEAIEMARLAAADGIQQMICTPHMFNGISKNPEPVEIFDRVSEFQQRIAQTGLVVLPGNEVHITHEIADMARENRVMRLNNKNYMLVEFPSMTVPVDADELFEGLRSNGVYPILVHPERNMRFQARPDLVTTFIEQGVYIQVTAMSVTGEFGAAAKKCADALLRHNCVHFLASDAHRPRGRRPILSKGRDAAAQVIGSEKARKLVLDNPLAVVRGTIPDLDPPIPWDLPEQKPRSSFFGKLFGSGN